MREFVYISGFKNKTSAKLERVFAQPMLLMARGFGPFARLHIVPAQQMEQIGMAQP